MGPVRREVVFSVSRVGGMTEFIRLGIGNSNGFLKT